MGQKWKTARREEDKEFTYEEIAAHIGVKLKGNARGYEEIRHILIALSAVTLISVSKEYFVGKGQSRHKLLKWSTEFSKLEDLLGKKSKTNG